MSSFNPIGSSITKGFSVSKAPPGLTSIRAYQQYPAAITADTELTNVNNGVLAAVVALLTGEVQAHANSAGTHVTVTVGGRAVHLTTDPQLTRTIHGPTELALLVPLVTAEAMLEPGADGTALHAHLQAVHQAGAHSVQALNIPSVAEHVLHLTALVEQRLAAMSNDSSLKFEDACPAAPRRDVTDVFRGKVIVLAPSMTPGTAAGSSLTARLRRWVGQGLNVLLTGPTSTFKTTAALAAATSAGAFIVMVGGRPGMEDRDLFGGTYPTDQGPRWVDGPVTEAFARAGSGTLTALVLNELTRFEPLHLGAMIGALDDVDARTARQMGLGVAEDSTDRYYVLRLPNGEVVFCPVRFLSVIGTTNIGSDYVTAQEIDAALMRRFQRHEDVPYAEEDRALQVIRAGNDPVIAQAAYTLEVRTRSEVQGSGLDGEGLLAREMNPSVSAALAQEATQLVQDGTLPFDAFVQAAEVTCIPYCVPRLTTGALDPAALERFKDLIAEIGSTL